MQHDWMLDVLADLRDYARLNALPGLGETLNQTLRTAQREIRGAGSLRAQSETDIGQPVRRDSH